MRSINSLGSICSHCGYYQTQRGWGGYCQQLGVDVKRKWKACPLAIPPFSSSGDNQDGIDCRLKHR